MDYLPRLADRIRHPFLWALSIVVAMACFFADITQVKVAVTFLGSLAIPVTACIAVYIAWRQYATDRLKLRLETYDRRLKIYEEAKRFVGVALSKDLDQKRCLEFYHSVAQADFLFGMEIRQYLDEMFKRANRLQFELSEYNFHQRVEIEGDTFDFAANSEKMGAQMTWFADQPDIVLRLFRPYLHLMDTP